MCPHCLLIGIGALVAAVPGVKYLRAKLQEHRAPAPEPEPECSACDGTGTDPNLEEVYEGNCLECRR